MLLKLFNAPDAITPAIIVGLPGASQEFKDWARYLYSRGTLDLFITALSASGVSKKPYDALVELSRLDISILRSHTIALSDFTGRSPSSLRRLVKDTHDVSMLNEQATVNQWYGTRTHAALLDYIENHELNRPLRLKPLQHRLLESNNTQEESLFDEREIDIAYDTDMCTLEPEEIIGTIQDCYNSILSDMSHEPNLLMKFIRTRRSLFSLARALKPLFGSHVDTVVSRHGACNDYLALYTFLTWARFVVHDSCHDDVFTMIAQEVPVFSKRDHMLSGGEIDGVVIPDIPENRRHLITRFSGREPHIGSLLHKARILNGNTLFVDFKAQWGDNDAAHLNINPDNVLSRPFRHHEDQMSGYIVKSNVAHYMCGTRVINDGSLNDIWEGPCRSGKIIYLFYDRPPVIHTITIKPDVQESIFRTSIAQQWKHALRNAGQRYMTNAMVSEILRRVNGEHRRRSLPQGSHQLSLIEDVPLTEVSSPIEYLVNKFRSWLDTHGVIEVTGKTSSGKYRYELHLESLFRAMKNGEIRRPPGFSQKTGGFIDCLNPSHLRKEGQKYQRTPSLHISYAHGTFTCFACEIGGILARDSIPSNISIDTIPIQSQTDAQVNFATIPEKHHEFMKHLSKLLQESFWDSPAEAYCEFTRMISPSLAYEYGAGFGTIEVIKKMLQRYTLGEMYYRGAIRYGSHPDSALMTHLRRKGLSVEQIRGDQEYNGEILRVPKDSYPYSPIVNRLSFPLSLGKLFTSLYLRKLSAEASKNAHYKLSKQFSGVDQGFFNGSLIYDRNVKELCVCEGVFDALSLLMTGLYVVGLIGTNSGVLMSALARSHLHTISLALDNDSVGEDKTRMRTKDLQRLGYKGSIVDFTWDFLRKFPSAKSYKDYNRWWIKEGRFLF